MKNNWLRNFLHVGRRGGCLCRDGEIALYPREFYGFSRQIQCKQTLILNIVDEATDRIAGEVALRIGESPELFYLGHIGYHVDPPFRGHGYAAKACRLCAPILREQGMRTVVITTDPGNVPSIRTCLRLGSELESTVSVPAGVQERLEISAEKHRFVWTLPDPETEQAAL